MEGARLNTLAMFEAVLAMDTRPFLPADITWLLPERSDAQFMPDDGGPSTPHGVLHVRLMPYGADFYLVKLFLGGGINGDKHQFMLMIGHNGDMWEVGPTFTNPADMADYLDRVASRYRAVDSLLKVAQTGGRLT